MMIGNPLESAKEKSNSPACSKRITQRAPGVKMCDVTPDRTHAPKVSLDVGRLSQQLLFRRLNVRAEQIEKEHISEQHDAKQSRAADL